MEYPVSYDTFKNRILELFIKKDWDYNTKFTKEQKQEYLDNTNCDFRKSYEEECRNYEKGFVNVFTTPEDTAKYIHSLLFECEMYFVSKELPAESSEKDSIDENKYPLTYEEFKKKMIELLIVDAGKISNVPPEKVPKDVEEFLEEYPTLFVDTYRECCEKYDQSKSIASKVNVFSDVYLSNYIWYWGMWMDYWFFL